MIKFLPILFIVFLACTSTKQTQQIDQQAIEPAKQGRAIAPKPIAPSTCKLTIRIDDLILDHDQFFIHASVLSTIEYGSSFHSIFTEKQSIQIKVSESQFKSIKNKKIITCQISSSEKLNQHTQYQLIKLIKL